MIDILWTIGGLLLLCTMRVNASVALLVIGLMACLVHVPFDTILRLIGPTVLSSFTYAVFGMVLLLVIGAAAQRVGAVQTFPDAAGDRDVPPRRAAWFAGGLTGIPVPLGVPVVLVGLTVQASIGTLSLTLIVPTLVLSLLYIGIFVVSVAGGAGSSLQSTRGAARVVPIVFRVITPLLVLPLLLGLIGLGLATPNEAMALVSIPLLLFALVVAGVSENGWRRLGAGLRDGVGGIAEVIMLVIGMALLFRGLGLAGSINDFNEALASLAPNATVLLLLLGGATLVVGMVTGPLVAAAIVMTFLVGPTVAVGLDMLVTGSVIVLAAEAVRVGPQLWCPGFRGSTGFDGRRMPGSWPYYLAAVAILVLSILLAGQLTALSRFWSA